MATNFSPRLVNSNPEPVSGMPLSIALISPNGRQREAAAEVLAGCTGYEVVEFPSYPARLDDVSELTGPEVSDVVIIDLDSDPEYALELVESISANGVGDGDGVFGKRRSGAAGALHARRSARVSDASA